MSFLNLIELLKAPIIYTFCISVSAGVISHIVVEFLKKVSEGIRNRLTIKTRNIAIIVSIIIIVIGLVYVFGPYKDQKISAVPDLSGLSKDMAAVRLDEAGLKSDLKERFNCTVEKNYIIPGTQDPGAGTYVQKNSSVKATISLGGIPDVTGLEEEQAILTLRESKLNYSIVDGRNFTVKVNYVYNQDPRGCERVIPGSKVTLFINRSINISIKSPLNGEETNSPVTVDGKITVPLLGQEKLWIVVNSRDALMNYYPQSGGPLIPREDLTFTGNAYLGSGKQDDIGKKYDLLVLVVDNDLSEFFKEYLDYFFQQTGDWLSVTDWTASDGRTVSQEEIIRSVKARVSNVGLKGYN